MVTVTVISAMCATPLIFRPQRAPLGARLNLREFAAGRGVADKPRHAWTARAYLFKNIPCFGVSTHTVPTRPFQVRIVPGDLGSACQLHKAAGSAGRRFFVHFFSSSSAAMASMVAAASSNSVASRCRPKLFRWCRASRRRSAACRLYGLGLSVLTGPDPV